MAFSIHVDEENVSANAVAQVRELVNDADAGEVSDLRIRMTLGSHAFVERDPWFWYPNAIPIADTRFDFSGAASDVLLILATRYRSQVDVKASGQDMALSQKALAAERQAALFAAKALVITAEVNAGTGWH